METLGITVADGVATVSMRRESVGNAIDVSVIRALHLALDQIQKS